MARTPRKGPTRKTAKGQRGRAAVRLPAVVRVTKGGDGGSAVPEAMLRNASFGDRRANLRQVLTGADIGRGLGRRARRAAREGFERALAETDDPFDAAHDDRAPGGVYYLEQGRSGVPRFGLADRPRRRYHESQMVGTGPARVGFDSAFDALTERVRRLGAEGVCAGLVGAIPSGFLAEQLDARLSPRVRLRDVLHKRTRQEMTAAELEAQRAGSRLLGVSDEDD